MTDLGGERPRRALAWMAAAALGLASAGIVYLRPGLSPKPSPSAGGAAAVLQPDSPVLIDVSFGDAYHGTVQEFGPGRTGVIYLTSDGGRTWKRLPSSTSGIVAVTFLGPRRLLGERLDRGTVDIAVSEDGGRT